MFSLDLESELYVGSPQSSLSLYNFVCHPKWNLPGRWKLSGNLVSLAALLSTLMSPLETKWRSPLMFLYHSAGCFYSKSIRKQTCGSDKDCLVSFWNDLLLQVCYRINRHKLSAIRLANIRKQLSNTSWFSNAVRFQEAENRVAGCEEKRGEAWQREIQSAELRQMSGASESTGCFLQPVQNVQSPRVSELPHLPWWGNLVVQCVCQRVVRGCFVYCLLLINI